MEELLNEQIEKLLKKFRGLRAEDLDLMNPEYSCCICGNTECGNHMIQNGACPDHTPWNERDWAKFYDF